MVWFGMGVYHIIISLYGMVWYGCLSYNYLPFGMGVYHGMVWYGCLSYNYLPLWYGLVWVFII